MLYLNMPDEMKLEFKMPDLTYIGREYIGENNLGKRRIIFSEGQRELLRSFNENEEIKSNALIELTHPCYDFDGNYHVNRLVFNKSIELVNVYEIYFERKE